MPPLEDHEIGALLDLLDRENRLGILKGKSRKDQEAAFRENAGRQLLVAMIQATSGKRFEDKCIEELTDLNKETALAYAVIAVASSLRYGLAKNDILVATGDNSNAILNAIDTLLGRHIVARRNDGQIWARHRTIADVIVQRLETSGQLASVLSGLAFLAASKVRPELSRSDRSFRLLRSVLSHDRLNRSIGLEPARNLYGSLETLLHWDYHYWLQRGSTEVEQGDLRLAEHFLNQARALKPDDSYVNNEWAYLLFSQALAEPRTERARDMARDAVNILEDLIGSERINNAYPYHVLGSQGLGWARRGIENGRDRAEFLAKIIAHVKSGHERFQDDGYIKTILDELTREYYSVAVSGSRGL